MSDTYNDVIVGTGSPGCVHAPTPFGTHDEPDLNRRRISLPRGRVLRGTSSINTVIHIRGNRLSFDARRQCPSGRSGPRGS
ncbi:GMC family oxidoreductase N-terminal domain-containing protein [Amycolatopsis mediterranei]|uniref:GMC family oxidoreductase N-terminal domain-containing protein n=1 Tax=Amycolatopsis mediterranei TaxID=33910 RepID=UPI003448774E